MSKKSIVKVISLVLSILILLTVLPVGAFAADAPSVTPETIVEDVTLSEQTENAVAGSRVRAEEGDSLHTIVVDNCDGTHTMTLYDHPVKFVNSKGEVEDISLEIASSADGSYKTKANDIQTVFPKLISDGISLSGKGVSVKLSPCINNALKNSSHTFGMTESKANGNLCHSEEQSDEESYKTPSIGQIVTDSTVTKIDNESVSYYYDNKTTLEYSLTYTGFKEDIVVSEYTGQTEYAFLLETGGLTLTKIDESYYLTDENGEIKATLGDIIIFTADERNNALGSMTHETVKENELYILTIHIDADYLKDEKTKYPIRIDPTIEISYDNNGSAAIQDVTINSNAGSSGTSGSLYVGKRNTYGKSRTLMKFPGLNLSAIPSNSTINSAYLEIRDLMCQTTSMVVYPYLFGGNDWDESTATWSNVNPEIITKIMDSSIAVSYSNGEVLSPVHRYNIDITQALRLWKSGLYSINKGILLKADSSVENGSTELYKTFASYNRSSHKPSIKITYTNNTPHTAYGRLETVDYNSIAGWVYCSNHPNEALDVVLTITNTSTGQSWRSLGKARTYRADVYNAGYGTGYYGFSASMGGWSTFPTGTYEVSAQAVLPNGSVYILQDSPLGYVKSEFSVLYPEGCGNYLLIKQNMTLQCSQLSGNYTVRWSCSDDNILHVNQDTGYVFARNIGMALVTATATDIDTGNTKTASKAVYVRGYDGIVDNRDYYIMNYKSKQYLSVSGTSVCVSGQNAVAVNKWTLNMQANKKYNLSNGATSSNNILNVNGRYLITSSNHSEDNLFGTEDFTLYRLINEGPTGLYYIRYKNLYLTQEGNGVVLTTTPSQFSCWSLMKVEKGNSYFVSTRTEIVDGAPYDFNLSKHKTSIQEKLLAMGYASFTHTENPFADVVQEYLVNAGAFISYVHSAPGIIQFHNLYEQERGNIAVNQTVLPYSDINYYISEDVQDRGIIDNSLADANFVFYIGCNSGKDAVCTDWAGDEVTFNLLTATYDKGAHFVLGCTETILMGQGNKFLEVLFADDFDRKRSIGQCVESAQFEAGWMSFPGGSQGYFPIRCVGDGTQLFEY